MRGEDSRESRACLRVLRDLTRLDGSLLRMRGRVGVFGERERGEGAGVVVIVGRGGAGGAGGAGRGRVTDEGGLGEEGGGGEGRMGRGRRGWRGGPAS